ARLARGEKREGRPHAPLAVERRLLVREQQPLELAQLLRVAVVDADHGLAVGQQAAGGGALHMELTEGREGGDAGGQQEHRRGRSAGGGGGERGGAGGGGGAHPVGLRTVGTQGWEGPGPLARAARTASRTRARVSARLPSTTAPAARRWPPPPKRSATRATSTRERARKLTLTPPRGCSMNNSPTSTPATLRG